MKWRDLKVSFIATHVKLKHFFHGAMKKKKKKKNQPIRTRQFVWKQLLLNYCKMKKHLVTIKNENLDGANQRSNAPSVHSDLDLHCPQKLLVSASVRKELYTKSFPMFFVALSHNNLRQWGLSSILGKKLAGARIEPSTSCSQGLYVMKLELPRLAQPVFWCSVNHPSISYNFTM